MATHCSILAWEIPWPEELGRLQSMGLQKNWTQLSKKTAKAVRNSITFDSYLINEYK